jgi:hypothetical protein
VSMFEWMLDCVHADLHNCVLVYVFVSCTVYGSVNVREREVEWGLSWGDREGIIQISFDFSQCLFMVRRSVRRES